MSARLMDCLCIVAGDLHTDLRRVEANPLCPVHGDERDTSIDRVRLGDFEPAERDNVWVAGVLAFVMGFVAGGLAL